MKELVAGLDGIKMQSEFGRSSYFGFSLDLRNEFSLKTMDPRTKDQTVLDVSIDLQNESSFKIVDLRSKDPNIFGFSIDLQNESSLKTMDPRTKDQTVLDDSN